MTSASMAHELVSGAILRGQAVVRCDSTTPVEAIRAEVRRIARERGVSVRTGMVDDVLAVVLSDADLWDASTATMRMKLSAPDEPNVVR